MEDQRGLIELTWYAALRDAKDTCYEVGSFNYEIAAEIARITGSEPRVAVIRGYAASREDALQNGLRNWKREEVIQVHSKAAPEII